MDIFLTGNDRRVNGQAVAPSGLVEQFDNDWMSIVVRASTKYKVIVSKEQFGFDGSLYVYTVCPTIIHNKFFTT